MEQLNQVHLNGLRAVEVAGRLGTLALAAAELGVSLGAVSQQILKTERQLGRTLFNRTPKGLVPTPFGAKILAYLERVERDAKGNEYGLSRLSRRIRTARGTAEDIIKAILADIDSHSHDQAQGQGDDMTILAMSIDGRRAKRKTTTLPGMLPDGPAKPARLTTEGGTIDANDSNEPGTE